MHLCCISIVRVRTRLIRARARGHVLVVMSRSITATSQCPHHKRRPPGDLGSFLRSCCFSLFGSSFTSFGDARRELCGHDVRTWVGGLLVQVCRNQWRGSEKFVLTAAWWGWQGHKINTSLNTFVKANPGSHHVTQLPSFRSSSSSSASSLVSLSVFLLCKFFCYISTNSPFFK